ncbi:MULTISPECIES: peptidylprolyl isomerase [unclassified Anaerobiospirillum]|uniref:peptidylprolyl isomerase n=1 Tax=unclassified Anaerobiospirillum TaxID=2647410 RepID=UPI001FF61D92|nr:MULTISPECIES: peptidylprolyl isomerase [unclassified Anaerobiospirillum]MCK0526835.1 peptidylprolyl isomerase [Anaerobiospirillum sp. NML120449]MCK0534498.1 peptidylprolyl isomerase [Anaerobiospirillum sp. NML120511]MCK0539839.1 peptidylprolyl isomerase [Anaerobiospirillum sp. NML02-A-032]
MVLSKINKAILATMAALSVGVWFSTASANVKALDNTAAVVNSDIVLESELNAAQAEVEQGFRQRGAKVDKINARRAALEQLITRSIILQQGKQFGLNLTDTQINTALEQAALRANTTVAGILKSFGNVDEATARQMYADELIISEVRNNQVRRRVRISDAEVNLLAKTLREIGSIEPSYHLAQIVVPLDARADFSQVNRATALANSIKAKARSGADFNSLAAQYAQGSAASQGGDLGYVPESQVPVPFLPALLKAREGDVLGPFRSPFGLHLLKLFDVSNQAVEPITTYKARHILLTTSVIFSDEAAVKELQALRRNILNGSISFAAAARKYSEDSGSASLGGDLGYAPASRYDPGFAQGLVALNKGQISQPVKSSFGWHLIYLENKKIDKDSDEAYSQRARELIYRRLFAEEAQAWEREIRSAAFVRVTDPELIAAGLDQSFNSENADNSAAK